MMNLLHEPWPWYIAGPLIGLMVPLLLLIGGKPFGISSNLRHVCAATLPCGIPFFQYDWKREGGWNLLFAVGIVIGGLVATTVLLPDGYAVAISSATQSDLRARLAFMISRGSCRNNSWDGRPWPHGVAG